MAEKQSNKENCLIYFDASSLLAESQKWQAHNLNLLTDSDPRCYVNIPKLVTTLARGRLIQVVNVFNSVRQAEETMLEKLRNMTNVKCVKGLRSAKVDIISLIDELFVIENEIMRPDAIIFVIGGVISYKIAVEMARKYHWYCELVSYSTSITEGLSNNEEDNDKFINIQLDHVARSSDSFLCCDPIESKYRPKSSHLKRSFVVCFTTKVGKGVAEKLSIDITSIVQYPCSFFSHEKYGFENIFFIINPSKEKGGYSFKRLWKKNEGAIRNVCQKRKGDLQHIMVAVDFFNKECNRTARLESLNRFQYLAITDDDDDNDSLEDESVSDNQVNCQDGKEIRSENDGAHSDGDTDVEIVEKIKTFKERLNMTEKQCKFHFTCQIGLKCIYQHDEKEQQFFAFNCGKGVAKFKSSICKRFEAEVCRYMQYSYLCSEAHGINEARCYNCDPYGKEGHLSDQCSESSSEQNISEKGETNNCVQQCNYGFRCKYGIRCYQFHSEEEKRFFSHNDNRGDWYYKTKKCRKTNCAFKDDTVLCPFFHNDAEARCKKCYGKGHFQDFEFCPKYGR